MVQLNVGDTLKVTVTFTYKGPAFSGFKCHVGLGNKGATFDEILFNESPALSVPVTPTPTVITVPSQYTNIVITEAISAGKYEIYAKLYGLPGADLFVYGPLDDIEILPVQGLFSNLQVTYSKL